MRSERCKTDEQSSQKIVWGEKAMPEKGRVVDFCFKTALGCTVRRRLRSD